MNRVINLGKHAANGGTRRINAVTITVNVEPSKYYDPATKTHYTKGEYFSVRGDVWNAHHTDIIRDGQCVDDIADNFARYNSTVKSIRALWEVFHLCQMENIPERFRAQIIDFVKHKINTVKIERKPCATYRFAYTEKVTDYGIFTDGKILVVTPDGVSEQLALSQGDENKHPIAERAHKAIKWLYEDAPSAEDLNRNAYISTQRINAIFKNSNFNRCISDDT